MTDEEKRDTLIILGATVGVYALVSWPYVKVLSDERRKRRKIRQWEKMNLDCINAVSERLEAMASDRRVPLHTFLEEMKAEYAFLDIVYNQPMY